MIVISPYKKRETKLDSERYYKSITNEDNNKISVDLRLIGSSGFCLFKKTDRKI